ncbi:uncharacterized protein LY89DRAFT_132648 [Mollisia scopiformis]|uniref:Secreted protein n=1 Tax=Mollisia scopiformis TaxID=149040 RepID=A0A194X1Z6_MOLSC|nr:uncharacterized protein LY89DRAFT_132648 [Mollisia scopiformis]KUJ14216.1 hypothetical protein LY89DRAFT_132648 [Mollisia scopiformis]
MAMRGWKWSGGKLCLILPLLLDQRPFGITDYYYYFTERAGLARWETRGSLVGQKRNIHGCCITSNSRLTGTRLSPQNPEKHMAAACRVQRLCTVIADTRAAAPATVLDSQNTVCTQ